MAAKPNPAFIGAFIIGAILLAIVGLVFLGSGKYFQKTTMAVAYFPGSLSGLSVGAPVNFRGVQIGEVTEIHINFVRATAKAEIPVVMEIRRVDDGVGPPTAEDARRLIERGLRAQLALQSFVTGQLTVELDFVENAPPPVFRDIKPGMMEIPTIPTESHELLDKLKKLDLASLIKTTERLMSTLNRIAQSAERDEVVPNIGKLVLDLNHLVEDVETKLDAMARNVDLVAGAAHSTLGNADRVIVRLGEEANDTLVGARELVVAAKAAAQKFEGLLTQANATLVMLEKAVDPNAPIGNDLRQTIVNIGMAARSVRALADELERNPSAILRGRQ